MHTPSSKPVSDDISLRPGALWESSRLANQFLETTLEGVLTVDQNDCVVYANPRACQMLGYANPSEILGVSVLDFVFPDDATLATGLLPLHRKGIKEPYEARLKGKNGHIGWAIVSVSPIYDEDAYLGAFAVLTDITARKKREQEILDLLSLRETERKQAEVIFGSMTDGLVILSPAGALLQMNPAAMQMHAFADLEDARGRLAELHQRFEFRDTGGNTLAFEHSPIGRVFAGETFSHQEAHVVQHDLQRSWWGSFAGTTVKSEGGDPLLVILTIREITQIKQAQIELTEALQRDVRLHEIGQKLRLAPDAASVRRIAVEALGEYLKVDRCYFDRYDAPNNRVWAGPQWSPRGDATATQRLLALSDNPLNADPAYLRGGTQAISDVLSLPIPEGASPTQTKCARAVLRVPLTPGVLTESICLTMDSRPHEWTQSEIHFAENVALQTQAALEAALSRERDRRIATQLQEALLPDIPPLLPGLALGRTYRAALEEASIGGDFYDVFSLSPTRTALVVGDVAGKGLAAAAQVSTVRNMLRALLGICSTLGEAVNQLNRLLCQQNALQGFVTLFVGVADQSSRTLSWVSCGHEPGLLQNAEAGTVSHLNATGFPLCVETDALFDEGHIAFCSGDTLLLHTDGLTEAGPVREQMLGTSGVSRLFEQALEQAKTGALIGENEADAIARAVFAEAETFARGVLRDDVCLLVARAL